MAAGKLSCSACYEDIEEGDVEVVILTKNPDGWDFNKGWGGVITHKACASDLDWSKK